MFEILKHLLYTLLRLKDYSTLLFNSTDLDVILSGSILYLCRVSKEAISYFTSCSLGVNRNSLCIPGIKHDLLPSADLLKKKMAFKKKSFRNSIRVSNTDLCLDSDQT